MSRNRKRRAGHKVPKIIKAKAKERLNMGFVQKYASLFVEAGKDHLSDPGQTIIRAARITFKSSHKKSDATIFNQLRMVWDDVLRSATKGVKNSQPIEESINPLQDLPKA